MRWFVLLLPGVLAASPAAFEAVRNGEIAGLTAALGAGASPNAKDADGQTLLIHAVVYLPAGGVKLLLDRGADANLAGKGGTTALMAAGGDIAKVRLLVERGADVNARSAGGNTPLRHAMALAAGKGTVLYLLAHGAKPEAGELNRAVRRGDPEISAALLKAGAPVTPEAVRRAIGNEMMTRLLGATAEAQRRAVSEETAPGSGVTNLMTASYDGNEARVRALIGFGANVNAKDNRGRTVLMYAAGADEPSATVVKLLLDSGADPAAKDVRGDTALDLARQRGRKEIILALGGKPDAAGIAPVLSGAKTRPLKEAIEKAVGLMERAGPEFHKVNGCISCHQQSIPQMAAGAARAKGLTASDEVRTAQATAVTGMLKLAENNLWQLGCSTLGGFVATLSYDLAGLAGDGQPRSKWTDLAAHCLAKAQTENGAWSVRDLRQPLGDNDAKYTALSIRGLLSYPLPGLREEFTVRVARGAAYLENSNAADTQSLAFRILGLQWAGRLGMVPGLKRQLEGLQHGNGGWSQHAEMAPDAYATAIALWALADGGAYGRGAAYLRRTQQEDGSWHVRSRGFGFQPYRETGFPHGHDQWISSAATGFAVLALTPLL